MRKYIDLLEAREKSGVIMDELLSFPQADLLQMYVDSFNDQESMEFWLQVDADALPETPEIAREWMKANYAEESSHSLAEMIIGDMTEEEVRDYGMNANDEANLEQEMSESELDEAPALSHQNALDLMDMAVSKGNEPSQNVKDALAHYEKKEVTETEDEYGYDADAEMDRDSMVQTQIEDVLARTNTLMDKIGNEQPTADQQGQLDAYADRITQLEKSLEN